MIGTLTKIILDKNTPEIFAKELSTCAVADLKLNMIIESDSINFLRKGNLERFQQQFFLDVVIPNNLVAPKLSCGASTYLLKKLCDILYTTCKREFELPETVEAEIELSNRELNGLHYIAGYVVRKLYKKYRFSQKGAVKDREKIATLLIACRGQMTENSALIDALTRGGLWYVKTDIQVILQNVELHFRHFRNKNRTLKNAINCIVATMLNDVEITDLFQNIVVDAAVTVENEFQKLTLQSIIELFLRVRVHSYAKQKTAECEQKEAAKIQ
eukprot:TCONS_00064896-protein